jgi:hypothetical protein
MDKTFHALLDEAGALFGDMVRLRRRFHRHPEVGLQLPVTQEIILEGLTGLGLEMRTGERLTSVVAIIACEIVQALQTYVTRRVNVFDPAVITIARITAGTTGNVIPEMTILIGTMRTVSERTRAQLCDGARRLAEGIAKAHGAEAEVTFGQGPPVLINDGNVVDVVSEVARRLFGPDHLQLASTLDGLVRGYLDDPEFVRIVEGDLIDGQHRNPTNHPRYFTTAFFHSADKLKAEIEEAGLHHEHTLAIEGPGWLLHNFEAHWQDHNRRERLLNAIRWFEHELSILGVSAHMMAIARKGIIPP